MVCAVHVPLIFTFFSQLSLTHLSLSFSLSSHQGDHTWATMLGQSVRLQPVPIQSLSELERARLQQVALYHLDERDLDFKISIPRGTTMTLSTFWPKYCWLVGCFFKAYIDLDAFKGTVQHFFFCSHYALTP